MSIAYKSERYEIGSVATTKVMKLSDRWKGTTEDGKIQEFLPFAHVHLIASHFSDLIRGLMNE